MLHIRQRGLKAAMALAILAISIFAAGCGTLRKKGNSASVNAIKHEIAIKSIDNNDFMLCANRLMLMNTPYTDVYPTTNFIYIHDDIAMVQVAPAMAGGQNGVGGYTIRGPITHYEKKWDKKGNLMVLFHVGSSTAACDVVMHLYPKSNEGCAYIHTTLDGARATLYGEILPYDITIFEGHSLL